MGRLGLTPRPPRFAIARPDESGALVSLECACFPPADRFPRRSWARLIGPAAAAGTAITLVAREGDIIRASASLLLRSGSRVARIYSLAVDPAWRGRGIGGALLAALRRHARRRGCTVLSLEVRADNAAARALYERTGFTAVAPLPGYYADGADGVRYRLAIA